MKIKKDDLVRIIKGKDRGKKGKVIQVFVRSGKVVVENVNMMVKNVRPKKAGDKGEKVKYAAPLDAANTMLICPKCSKPTRVSKQVLEKEKIRI